MDCTDSSSSEDENKHTIHRMNSNRPQNDAFFKDLCNYSRPGIFVNVATSSHIFRLLFLPLLVYAVSRRLAILFRTRNQV